MKNVLNYSIELILTFYVAGLVSLLIMARYFWPIKHTWQSKYFYAKQNNPKIEELNNVYLKNWPDMPEDVRLFYVIQDLRDEFNYSQDRETYKLIKLLEKIYKQTIK